MKTLSFPAVLISLVLLSSGCNTAERMLDQGRYDDLLSYAQRKMSGKPEKKEKYVRLVEEAFAKVTDRDMDRVERLKSSNRSEDWQEIVVLAERIERRQERLEPFLPLVADNGYQASFTFVKTHDIISFAENQIVENLYAEGLEYLQDGRAGDKHSAQQAYHKFQEVLGYRSGYREAVALRDEARETGVVHVQLSVENRMRDYIPGYVAEVLDESVSASNGFWVQYYFDKPADKEIDFIARLVVNTIDVGPDGIREEKISRQKKIEDGWDYVLDKNGNVTKDTAGNDIKIPRYREVQAVVLKTHQEKGVYIRGRVEVESAKSGQILDNRPLQVESRFYHQAQSFFGDERALEPSDKVFVGLVPFPSNEAMLVQVAELVRPAFINELNKCNYL